MYSLKLMMNCSHVDEWALGHTWYILLPNECVDMKLRWMFCIMLSYATISKAWPDYGFEWVADQG